MVVTDIFGMGSCGRVKRRKERDLLSGKGGFVVGKEGDLLSGKREVFGKSDFVQK